MSENEDKIRCSVCKIGNFERNKYYYGKLMTVRDYQAEQCYFNEKRWLINRMVNGWGVVCGLDVKRKPIDNYDESKGYSSEEVIITPGLAIDCCGREILVCEPQSIKLKPENSECRESQNNETPFEDLVICLEYYECETEQGAVTLPGCNQNGKSEFNRIRESFNFRVRYKNDVTVEPPFENICPSEQKIVHFFNWDEIKNDDNGLKQFFLEISDIDWITNGVLEKNDNEIRLSNEGHYLALRLNDEKTEVSLTFNEIVIDTFLVTDENDIFKAETIHSHICNIVKEDCPKCPECPCLVLAEISMVPLESEILPPILRIDTCSNRKLIHNNPLLYDLINCYHGDLPHIIDINWPHDQDISWETFVSLIDPNEGSGFQVIFDRIVKGIDKRSFVLIVKLFLEDSRFFQDLFIPGDVELIHNKAVFKVNESWYNDMMNGSFIHQGAGFRIVLRSDFILDQSTDRALDGNFIGGKLPSGNGTQGGDFVSWFYVEANPEPPSRIFMHKK